MRIKTRELTDEEVNLAKIALGYHWNLQDNERNARKATNQELNDFCFGPLKNLVNKYQEKEALKLVEVPQLEIVE